MSNSGETAARPDADERRDWARQALEVPDGRDGRAHVLQCLAEQEFVLYDFQREAADVLWGNGKRDSGSIYDVSAFDAARTRKIGEDIDTLAAEFFAIPTNARRERWNRLRQTPGLSPPQRLRLDDLLRGLDVVPASDDEEHGLSRLGELMAVVCDLFVLSPTARAHHRAAFLRRAERDRRQWAEAATKLSQAHSAVAGLLPDFVVEVSQLLVSRESPRVRRRRRRAAAVSQTVPSGSESNGRGWIYGVIAVSVLTTIGRLASDSGRYESPTSGNYRGNPTLTLPQDLDRWNVVLDTRRDKSDRARLRKLMQDAGVKPEEQRRIERRLDALDSRKLLLEIRRRNLRSKQRELAAAAERSKQLPKKEVEPAELREVEQELQSVEMELQTLQKQRKELLKDLPIDDEFRRKAEDATRILFGKPPRTESKALNSP